MKKKVTAIVSALIAVSILFVVSFIFILKPGFKYLSETIKIQKYMNSGNYKEAVNSSS